MARRDPEPPAEAGADAATRPVSLWPETTRPAELPSTAFAASRFDPLADERARAEAFAAAAFDLCRPRLAAQCMLLVEAAVLVGTLAASVAGDMLWSALARSGLAALLGTLAWLLVLCASGRWLFKLRPAARAAVAVALGAAAGGVGIGPVWVLDAGAPPFALALAAAALVGAALAGALWAWLDLRARAASGSAARPAGAAPSSRPAAPFVRGALNAAQALLRVDPAGAERVLADLIRLFGRPSTLAGDAGRSPAPAGESITLDEEVELARAYLAIEQVRFGQRLRVAWTLEPRAGAARVPPMLLQPLVENAVRHGCELAAGMAQIWLRTEVRQGRAVVELSNSVPADAPPPGLGPVQTELHERLRLLHAARAHSACWRDGRVHHVRIELPL